MATVRLDSALITDWASFHQLSKEGMGFPDFYGANMKIDCLTYVDEGDGMSRFQLSEWLQPRNRIVYDQPASSGLLG